MYLELIGWVISKIPVGFFNLSSEDGEAWSRTRFWETEARVQYSTWRYVDVYVDVDVDVGVDADADDSVS